MIETWLIHEPGKDWSYMNWLANSKLDLLIVCFSMVLHIWQCGPICAYLGLSGSMKFLSRRIRTNLGLLQHILVYVATVSTTCISMTTYWLCSKITPAERTYHNQTLRIYATSEPSWVLKSKFNDLSQSTEPFLYLFELISTYLGHVCAYSDYSKPAWVNLGISEPIWFWSSHPV